MRRLVLVFLLMLLPLQWSWAAAAGACAHDGDRTHFGHHEHRHAAPADDTASADSAQPNAAHADCQVCHGVSAGVLHTALPAPQGWADASALPDYTGGLPEPPIEAFLRPPLPPVA